MTDAADAVALLRDLVARRSVSGEELAVVQCLEQWLGPRGVVAHASGRNLVAQVGTGTRRLLFTSHTDTVPVAPGWTRDPFEPGDDPDVVHGLGSSDAKASIAAMACALVRLARAGLPGDTAVVFAAVCDEEVGGEGMPVLVAELPDCAAAVVGEPTDLDVCPGQRGYVRIEGVARGQAGHASRPWEGRNAIALAAADVERLGTLPLPPPDPLLGPATVCLTLIEGGSARNVIPGECRYTVDVRTTPACDNATIAEQIRAACRADIAVKSDRIRPVITPADAPIVRAARAALPDRPVRSFGGVSDLAFVGVPGIVCGPGDPRRSHQADEHIATAAVAAAVDAYVRIAEEFFTHAA